MATNECEQQRATASGLAQVFSDYDTVFVETFDASLFEECAFSSVYMLVYIFNFLLIFCTSDTN